MQSVLFSSNRLFLCKTMIAIQKFVPAQDPRLGFPRAGDATVNVNRAINIDDLRKMAKRRLPRIIYDFIEGGVEDELGIARNEAAFDRERLHAGQADRFAVRQELREDRKQALEAKSVKLG